MPMPSPAASIELAPCRLVEEPVDEVGGDEVEGEEPDDDRRDAGEHLDHRLDDPADARGWRTRRGRSPCPRPNGTATSMATAPMITLPTTIVRRSKRSRRGNQPVSVSTPKSQSIGAEEVDRALDQDVQDQRADHDRQQRRGLEHRRASVRSRAALLARCPGGPGPSASCAVSFRHRARRRSWPAAPGGTRPATSERRLRASATGPGVLGGLDAVGGQVDVSGVGDLWRGPRRERYRSTNEATAGFSSALAVLT